MKTTSPKLPASVGGKPPLSDETPAPRQPVRSGSACPRCGIGLLDYNGLLDLECPVCGYIESGGGGCT